MDCSLPGSSVHGILQVRVLEWVAMLSPPGNLPDPGVQPKSPALQADSLPTEPSWKPHIYVHVCVYVYINVYIHLHNGYANGGDVRDVGDSLIGKIPWRTAWQPTPVLLPGESH